MRDGHSSGTTLARCLEQPTRTASLTSPCGVIVLRRTSRVAVPIRFCSRCGLPCRFRCRKRGALLPHLFTLTRLALAGYGKRFVLCGTFPGVAPAGRYPAPFFHGARTFLPGHDPERPPGRLTRRMCGETDAPSRRPAFVSCQPWKQLPDESRNSGTFVALRKLTLVAKLMAVVLAFAARNEQGVDP